MNAVHERRSVTDFLINTFMNAFMKVLMNVFMNVLIGCRTLFYSMTSSLVRLRPNIMDRDLRLDTLVLYHKNWWRSFRVLQKSTAKCPSVRTWCFAVDFNPPSDRRSLGQDTLCSRSNDGLERR